MSVVRQLEELFEDSFQGPFPYEECRVIARFAERSSDDLIQELDWYFANVAGYSSSASQLQNRSVGELSRAKQILSKDFFEYFPEQAVFRDLIDSVHAPRLCKRMIASEQMRIGLLKLLDEISLPER